MHAEISGMNLAVTKLSGDVKTVIIPLENENYTQLTLTVGQIASVSVPYGDRSAEVNFCVEENRVRETVVYPTGESGQSIPFEMSHGIGSEVWLLGLHCDVED
jgi:hypothetical protein